MNKVKLATICCFILALSDEIEREDRVEELRAIRKRCQDYINRYPQHLDLVANKAWEIACDYTEGSPTWSPAIVLILLWKEFMWELKQEVKLNPKHGEKLYNKQQVTLTTKRNSYEIAKSCIKAINKVLYDNKGVIE